VRDDRGEENDSGMDIGGGIGNGDNIPLLVRLLPPLGMPGDRFKPP